jgi:hypothetical protein
MHRDFMTLNLTGGIELPSTVGLSDNFLLGVVGGTPTWQKYFDTIYSVDGVSRALASVDIGSFRGVVFYTICSTGDGVAIVDFQIDHNDLADRAQSLIIPIDLTSQQTYTGQYFSGRSNSLTFANGDVGSYYVRLQILFCS